MTTEVKTERAGILHRFVGALFSRQSVPYWFIFFFALMIRALDQYFMSHNAPTYGLLWPDSHVYDRWAREAAQTFWLGWRNERVPFTHGPLYPYYLALLYLRFDADIAVAAWSQRILGAIAVCLLFWLGRRLFSKGAGWFAGLGAALCPVFLMYEGEILLETLLLLLHVAALCCFVKAFERKTYRWWTGAGLMLGLCCLCRPNAVLFIPMLAPWSFLAMRGTIKRRILAAVLVGGTALAVIAPATMLNYFVGGKFCLITESGSYNMYVGNAPDSNGVFASPPSAIAIREQEGKEDEDIDWRKHLWTALRQEPWSMPRNLLLKLALFWQSGEIPSGPNYYLQREFSPLLRLPFRWAFIAPLALIGIALAFYRMPPRQWDDPRLLAAGWLLLFMVSIVLVFVMGRLRLPALAILLLFAGYALTHISDALKSIYQGKPERFRICLAIGVLALWPTAGWLLQTPSSYELIGWNDYFNLGRAYESQSQYAEALEQYEKALRMQPDAELLISLVEQMRERIR